MKERTKPSNLHAAIRSRTIGRTSGRRWAIRAFARHFCRGDDENVMRHSDRWGMDERAAALYWPCQSAIGQPSRRLPRTSLRAARHGLIPSRPCARSDRALAVIRPAIFPGGAVSSIFGRPPERDAPAVWHVARLHRAPRRMTDRRISSETRLSRAAVGAAAVGLLGLGACAIGALVIGRLAIRRLRIERASIRISGD